MSFFIAWRPKILELLPVHFREMSVPTNKAEVTSAFMSSSQVLHIAFHCLLLGTSKSQVGSDLWEVAIAPYHSMGEEFVVMF